MDLPPGHIGFDPNRYSGSINASLFLAIYLGFKKIYMVGFDYTHAPSRILHWYEKGEGWKENMPDYNKEYLKLALNYADIYAVTIDGEAHNLPSISYEVLTGDTIRYKENNEILSEENMNILSTWPGYRIYG